MKYISSQTYWYANGNLEKKHRIEAGEKDVKLDNPSNVRTRGWMLTVPAKSMSFETLDTLLSKMASRDDAFAAKFQIERGKNTEYEHYQLFMYWKSKKSGSSVMTIFPGVHIEPSIKIEDSIKYVGKEDTRVAGPYVYGIADQIAGMAEGAEMVKRSMNDSALEMIKKGWRYDDFIMDPQWRTWALSHKKAIIDMDIAYAKQYYSTHVRPVSVDYVYGPTGTMKTMSVLQMYGGENVFIADLSSSFPFDGYDGESVLLLDDYRSDFKFSYLLRVLQGQPFRVNVKGASTWARWTKVIITSNLSLQEQYPNIEERKDPMYRRFEHGIVFMKLLPEESLPYASRDDAMHGIPTGYPNGVPGWSKSAAAEKYERESVAGYTPKVRSMPDKIVIDGKQYWDVPATDAPDGDPDSESQKSDGDSVEKEDDCKLMDDMFDDGDSLDNDDDDTVFNQLFDDGDSDDGSEK